MTPRERYIQQLFRQVNPEGSLYGIAIAYYNSQKPDEVRLREIIDELEVWALESPRELEQVIGIQLTEILYAKKLTKPQPLAGLN